APRTSRCLRATRSRRRGRYTLAASLRAPASAAHAGCRTGLVSWYRRVRWRQARTTGTRRSGASWRAERTPRSGERRCKKASLQLGELAVDPIVVVGARGWDVVTG